METYTTYIRFRLCVNDSGEFKERISRLEFSPLFFERFETMFIIDVVKVKQTTM